MSETRLKALITAMVIHQSFDGIIPSYSAYGDSCASIQDDINERVQEIFETYKTLIEDL